MITAEYPWNKPLPAWLDSRPPVPRVASEPEPVPAPPVPSPSPEPQVRSAKWVKLDTGFWGIAVVGTPPIVGEIFGAENSFGKLKRVTVSEVVWRSNSLYRCSIVETSRVANKKMPFCHPCQRCHFPARTMETWTRLNCKAEPPKPRRTA